MPTEAAGRITMLWNVKALLWLTNLFVSIYSKAPKSTTGPQSPFHSQHSSWAFHKPLGRVRDRLGLQVARNSLTGSALLLFSGLRTLGPGSGERFADGARMQTFFCWSQGLTAQVCLHNTCLVRDFPAQDKFDYIKCWCFAEHFPVKTDEQRDLNRFKLLCWQHLYITAKLCCPSQKNLELCHMSLSSLLCAPSFSNSANP